MSHAGLALCLLAVLLTSARAARLDHQTYNATFIAPGVCPTIDIRSTVEQLQKLRGCRVVEGQLSIVLLEWANTNDFMNISFPELREVTGYIKIYRLKGLRSLGDLFPNLTVVRGMQLFKDYALVVFDNEHMESIGLRSLTRIERGAVRIQNNDRMCYTNTIDWRRIISPVFEDINFIRNNYDTRLCGLCPYAQGRNDDHRQASAQCPSDAEGRLLCWDDKHCQKVCKGTCGDSGCLTNGECCHQACLGGCSGPSSDDCYVCRHFSFLDGPQRKCVEQCPPTLLKLNRRCVTESECRGMPPPLTESKVDGLEPTGPNIRYYKIFNDTSCVYQCPSGYMEVGDAMTARCVPCPDKGCTRECNGGIIDSVASAEQFRGCTHIKTHLEISLRASGGNTMAVLEASLGEIREIKDYLKVSRSYPLVSLMFLKNLEKIGGVSSESKGTQSLHIFKNPNLELLWDWSSNKTIEITRGKVFIHYNPKLCYNQIRPLMNMTKDPMATFTESEVSTENNGDQAPCYQSTLQLRVHMLHRKVVFLTWNMYCMPDIRKLLGYSIYYIVADHNVTLYEQRDACSDSWSVLDITMDDVRNNTRLTDTNPIDNPCKNTTLQQPLFYPLSQLTPFTRYAAYVKTYTTLQDKKGAQSPIIYFTTLPGRPSPPVGVTVEPGSQNVYIRWLPPRTPNGTISHYVVGIQANTYNKQKILQYDKYCTNPSALATMISVSKDDVKESKDTNMRNDDKNEQCACKANEKPGSKFSTRAEKEQVDSIYFEDELQNTVYQKKKNTNKGNNEAGNRSRRSIEDGQSSAITNTSSMLVVLAENKSPTRDENYDNITDEKGYLKSIHYKLDGKVNSLFVKNMRHFTWYIVNVWACREKHPNETEDEYYDSWCSERAYNIFRTLELVNVDVVSTVKAEVLSSNKSLPEVNVTWQPPTNPNGFVLAYTVHHWRVDDGAKSQDVGLQSCIKADEYEANHHSHLLRNLPPGNYGLTVTPITVSGAGNVSEEIFITIPERPSTTSQLLIWGLVGGCLAMLALLGAGVWYARRGVLAQTEASKLIASVNPEYVSTVYVPDDWEVPRSSIEFIKELGQGSFGMVYEGLAKNIEKGKRETKCAIKTVNEHATERERIEFLNEASVMKAFDTHHVVRLLGVVSQGQPTLVVMELMENGDLKTYLRSHRPDADGSLPKKNEVKTNPPTLQNILQMAIEIADGMAYLSAKKFVHRDLAARNCMVAGDLTVKVGDFGMTRDIYETDYYRKGTKGLLPVRWMSPESLKDGIFSSSSDIWSYGVVLWEMATLAMQPYQGLSNEQVLRYVVEGGVMERPEHCPDRLYELMRQCWAHRPSMRPSFLRLVADLAPTAAPHFRQRSFFHSTLGQELYAMQSTEDELELPEVNVGAVATGSGSNLFGVSGRLASWVRELSSLRSRNSDDAAAEPLQPADAADRAIPLKATAPNTPANGSVPRNPAPC